mmetsp:Transcript_28049/g.46054  ORF Transcript_28049/g.46054 Transcript_28049/m.46054 type:complete len:94 (+) Transcript_28049:1654-1935(+)
MKLSHLLFEAIAQHNVEEVMEVAILDVEDLSIPNKPKHHSYSAVLHELHEATKMILDNQVKRPNTANFDVDQTILQIEHSPHPSAPRMNRARA